jgi:predicted metal-dependent phosphoesterase TrpH
VLKAELHAHTADDPRDYIPHSATELIERAAQLGYGALAVTLHDRSLDITDLAPFARSRGICLIRGIERAIEHKHVLLLNFGDEAEQVDDFDALAELRQANPGGLVIAPHPFYPGKSCVGHTLDRRPDLFDAVELNAFYTSAVDTFNTAALRCAERHGKPVVANADVHRLRQLGRTYSLVHAEPNPDAVCEAIRAGRVEIRTAPLSTREAIFHLGALASREALALLTRSRTDRAPRRPAIEFGK